jgi:hypothetical protein
VSIARVHCNVLWYDDGWWIRSDFEGSRCDLIEVIFKHLPCPGQDLNWGPPEFECRALPQF